MAGVNHGIKGFISRLNGNERDCRQWHFSEDVLLWGILKGEMLS